MVSRLSCFVIAYRFPGGPIFVYIIHSEPGCCLSLPHTQSPTQISFVVVLLSLGEFWVRGKQKYDDIILDKRLSIAPHYHHHETR